MDADLSLEVTAPSLGGGRREKIREEGSDIDLKNNLLAFWDEIEELEFGHSTERECMACQY